MARSEGNFLLHPAAGHGGEAEGRALRGGDGGGEEGEDEKSHHVVDHGRAEDDGSLGGVESPGIHQGARGNGYARGGESAAQEERGLPREAEDVTDTCTEQKRPDDAGKRDDEGSDARFAHTVDVGFNSGDEHQDDDADLREQKEGTRGFRALKQAHVENIERAGPQGHADQQLSRGWAECQNGCKTRRQSCRREGEWQSAAPAEGPEA